MKKVNQTTLTGEIISEQKAEKAYVYLLPFSYDYPKFSDRKFTSIRKKRIPKKYHGKTWLITVKHRPREQPFMRFLAHCLSVQRVKIRDISTDLLIRDTQTKSNIIESRDDALAMIQQFYRNKITEETEVSLIFLKRNFWR